MAKFNSSTIAFATIIAFGAIGQAAQAGESYVTNRDITSWSRTTTNLTLDSDEWSNGRRDWGSYAYKTYQDGSVTQEIDCYCGGYDVTTTFKDFTFHTASAGETGYETFGSTTKLDGSIFTQSGSDTTEHETAAGNR
ncbi:MULTISPECIES: hypothetical protein [Cyanophyceae]|uniref:hypothetical protein n=1 Tax=Cyanophyceae TaxID=3028117 RepID=UPI0004AAF942|nr:MULTISPECIES: hypothetical protein [Cyanophyceae]AMA08696.1 hypothetical protein AWQ23_04825 [Picosynechococcus sp. PCC 73109]